MLPGRTVKGDSPEIMDGSRTSQATRRRTATTPQSRREAACFPRPARKHTTAYRQQRAKGYIMGFHRTACRQSSFRAEENALVIPQPGHGIPVKA